jgi:hypothetical protein
MGQIGDSLQDKIRAKSITIEGKSIITDVIETKSGGCCNKDVIIFSEVPVKITSKIS